DLEALARLHPAWPERDSLTALIASAHESHQRPIPPFRVPPEPSLPAVSLEPGVTEATERGRMERLIQTRIQRDFDAVRDKVDRDVDRLRETEQAAAEKQALLDAAADTPAFLQQYQAASAQYADRIAPLQLELIGLQPQPTPPGPTAAAARRRAAATSASALATMDRYHEAARDVEHQLYVQREELERLILEATRAAVIQLARTHHVGVRFAPATGGPDLT